MSPRQLLCGGISILDALSLGWLFLSIPDPALQGAFPGKADSPGSLPTPPATIWIEEASVVSSPIPRGVLVGLHLS